jgi:hypothetical protein
MPSEAMIEEVGGLAVVVGSREQLLHLLAEASEIEHTLMCSYLYAAFSLKRAGDPGVSAPLGETLERWRKAVMDIAVEEMGHLLMGANLTVALGGRPHFGRPNFPVAPGYFPSDVVVRLTRFDANTLKHFIFLERPQDARGEDSAAFAQGDYCREQARPGLMPSAQDYATIGHLYAAIRTNLVALDRDIGSDALFLGRAESQVGLPVIDLDGVEPIVDLAGAERAIDLIRIIADSCRSGANSMRPSPTIPISHPPGRSPTARCCAGHPSPRARCSSITRGQPNCSISPARPTACCCAASSSASTARGSRSSTSKPR